MPHRVLSMWLERHRRIEVRWHCGTLALEHAEPTSGVAEQRVHDTHFQVLVDQRKLDAAALPDVQLPPKFDRYGDLPRSGDRLGFHDFLKYSGHQVCAPSHEFPTLECFDILSSHLEPFAILSLGLKAAMPVDLDSNRIIGTDHMNRFRPFW